MKRGHCEAEAESVIRLRRDDVNIEAIDVINDAP